MCHLHVAITTDISSQDTTFLEACIENHTKSNLYMDQVEFEPVQSWNATKLKADEHHPEKNSVARCVCMCVRGISQGFFPSA